jgi:S-DNA-T family DNA segregation ATPase FtsK/SpoIIIE
VELTGYNGIPHLAAPVVVDMDRVIGTLQWALREMDERYERFSNLGARNIADYNRKIAESHPKRRPLPYIVIIIDELADLMMLAPEETEKAVTRLAQMARATGIHMVIATQRPSVDVVTGLIKANFPARIAFAVASSTDSRVILDATGAERLLGQGDMLFQSPDAASPVRLQGAFVSDKELDRLIRYWQRARRHRLVKAQEKLSQRSDGRTDAHAANPLPPQVTAPPQATENEEETAAAASKQATSPPSPAAGDAPSDHARFQPAAAPTAQQKPLWKALEEDEDDAEEEPFELDDELLPEAIALVRQLKKASTSMLQRRFRIGYTRAARIMDYMEEKEIIGPPTNSSKGREVYPPEEEEGD